MIVMTSIVMSHQWSLSFLLLLIYWPILTDSLLLKACLSSIVNIAPSAEPSHLFNINWIRFHIIAAGRSCESQIAMLVSYCLANLLLFGCILVIWNRSSVFQVFSHWRCCLKLWSLEVGQKAVVMMIKSAKLYFIHNYLLDQFEWDWHGGLNRLILEKHLILLLVLLL